MKKNDENLTSEEIRKYMCKEVDKVVELVSKRKHSDIERVIPKLFNNIVELANSALILHSLKQFKASDLILRSIFENYINFKFILNDKELINEKLKRYNYYWIKGYYDKVKNDTNSELLKELTKIFDLACENIFDDVHEEFNDKGKNKPKYSKWYTKYIKGNTIGDLAKAVGCKLFYEYDYWDISREIHALDGQDDFVFDQNAGGYYINYEDNNNQLKNIKIILADSISIIKDYYNSYI